MHNKIISTPAVAKVQPVNHLTQTRTLKLALDVHLQAHVVAMQYDGQAPRTAPAFYTAGFSGLGEKANHARLANRFVLRSRTLRLRFAPAAHGLGRDQLRHPAAKLGRPASASQDRPDRCTGDVERAGPVGGGQSAIFLARVCVPTETQERRRSESRLRQSLRRDLKMIVQRGRGLGLQYGYRLTGKWYGPRNWPQLPVPAWLIELLTPLRSAALALHEQVRVQTAKIEAQSTQPIPKGLGELTEQILAREVGDWTRFKNRRQVGSYLGLCPSEHSSGQRHQQGSVTKCGNPRLRWALCEAAWRLLKWQPQYRLCKKWRGQILDPKTLAAVRNN